MQADWREITLGEFVRLQRGHDLTEGERSNGSVPVMGSAGMNGFHDVAKSSGPGVVVGRSGASMGRIHYCPVDYWPHNTTLYVTDFLGNNIKFVYFYLSTLDLAGFNSGSAQPSLNRNYIYGIKVRVPGRNEQDAIAPTLTALDDKIALLRETNATLEAIAQALFKSWFVDFDPVRAKAEGREPEGIPPEIADLFPSEFEDSALGETPKGWRVGTLKDIAILNPESWTAKKHPTTVSYIDLANTKDNVVANVAEYEFDEAPSRARRVLRDGDTIVGTVRPGNRSFAYIQKPPSNLTASTGFAVLRPSKVQNTDFLYLAATQDSSIERLTHVADGAAYPAVRPEVVVGIQCVVPSDDIMQAFHDVAAPLLSSISKNQRQSQTLATLRDTLLPRLMSGKLRIPGVADQTEETAP